MVYIIQRQSGKLGPYDLAQVRAMAQAGECAVTDLVWPQGASTPTTVAALLQGSEEQGVEGTSTTAAAPEAAPAPVFKKGPALTSFYLAAASLIPVVGFFCALPAVFFGLKGLKETKGQPHSRERMHALVGVSVGAFLMLTYAFVIAFLVMNGTKK